MLQNLHQPIMFLHTKCPKTDITTGGVSLTESNQHPQSNLKDVFAIAVGARVMLTRNTDLSDHQVNGVMGTVTGYIKETHLDEIKYILVKLDDPLVAQQIRKKK